VTDKSERKIERPLTRITEADRKGDQRRLDRKLNRTLYLVVKREGAYGGWGFPSGRVEGRENLHQVCFISVFDLGERENENQLDGALKG
jgi:8-oxo-dGTP pyrophosphatase MutT (NUDIX family)